MSANWLCTQHLVEKIIWSRHLSLLLRFPSSYLVELFLFFSSAEIFFVTKSAHFCHLPLPFPLIRFWQNSQLKPVVKRWILCLISTDFCFLFIRDHRKIFVGDGRGRIYSWSVSESVGKHPAYSHVTETARNQFQEVCPNFFKTFSSTKLHEVQRSTLERLWKHFK